MPSQSISAPNISGAIIAGGRSRRFGKTNKALAKLGQQSLIEHVYERLHRQIDRLWLNTPKDFMLPNALAKHTELKRIADKTPSSIQKMDSNGPLNGILSTLEESSIEYEWLLICPCDTPFIPDNLASRLYAACLQQNTDLAIAASQGRYHPSISLWHRRLLPDLTQAVHQQKKVGFKQFYPETNHCFVEWKAERYDPFFNINYPQDLQSAQEIFDTLKA